MTPPKPILLISLGTTPAIVPEAFYLPGIHFAEVHVLTTARPKVSEVLEFFARHEPDVPLRISRVDGFEDFRGEEDHFRFEEVLYRWVLETGSLPAERFFCLSGGFKTMSSAVQRAAGLLGAAEVFHVLADACCPGDRGELRPPVTGEEVLSARDEGHLHWIRLGGEPGWPQLRSLKAESYPLLFFPDGDGVRWVTAPDDWLRLRMKEVEERSHRIAESWDQLPELPFVELASWPRAEVAWLGQPLDPGAVEDQEWVLRLPKVELHCHLGGFATQGELLAEVRAAAEEPARLPELKDLAGFEGWPLPGQPVGLEAYRPLGDNNGSALLKDPGCLRKQCELLYEHLLDQNIYYAEIRCSPGNYANPARGRSAWSVLAEIRETFQAAMEAELAKQTARIGFPRLCQVNLILIGTREERGDYRAGIARHLALAVTAAEHWRRQEECRVVGVDLAGYESRETRAHVYREDFTGVHRAGLALTVHAGENDDAEGIWRAVFELNARRLGHASTLGQSPELLGSVVDRGIALEMCPYANLQIQGYRLAGVMEGKFPDYPLLAYLRRDARVTVNTDNIGISGASITDNLMLAARLCPGLTRLDILRLIRHAVDAAFVSTERRSRLVKQIAASIPWP